MATFLLEVGTEDLPARFVHAAIAQWQTHIPASLTEHYLEASDVAVYGTPRRLAVVITGLPTQQPDREEEVKGPAAQAAFKDGKPTKAAEGFARSRGGSVEALQVRSTDKGDFVFLVQRTPGRPTAEVLTELVLPWITSLEGDRFMRWGDGDLRFPRPIRWLVTLLDDQVLPLVLENGAERVESDRLSQGHRVLHPDPVRIAAADQYVETLRKAYVEVDPEQRRTEIEKQIQTAAKSVKGVASVSPKLLEEVVDLVEYPTAVVGSFDAEFLELPSQVIISEMESHQRYFPVLKSAGSDALLPYFITISNGDPAKSQIISAGNERVLRARLSDGKFFFDADRTIALEDYLPRLEQVTFQRDLGSVREKVNRIGRIANHIADQLDLGTGSRTAIQRTALLCKADLVTQMVGEFPELQGVMGQKYAAASGEPQDVADGIFEHYLPRTADDLLPETLTGRVVGLSDRLDTLVGIFGIGKLPSGSSDPFALRRAANAVVAIAWDADWPLNLHDLLEKIVTDFVATFPQVEAATLLGQLRDFFLQRIRTLLQDECEVDYDLVNAVLGENDPTYAERALQNLVDVRERALFLQLIRANGTLDTIYETVNRASRLAAQGDLGFRVIDPKGIINPDLFEQPSESAFYEALVAMVPQTQAAQHNCDYQTLVQALAKIAPVVSQFFDGEQSVLVMAEDPAIQRNRLYLLGLLRNHARVLADFGAIVKH